MFNHRDVTDRKRPEEEVRRLNEELENRVKERTARLECALAEFGVSEERHRLLVDNVEDYAIFMVDPDGRVADWNVGAERIFGYREVEIAGEESSLLFTPEDRQRGAPEVELSRAAPMNSARSVAMAMSSACNQSKRVRGLGRRSRQTSGRFLPVAIPSLADIDWMSMAIRLEQRIIHKSR